jgi:lysophospholipase L1-like esterase
MNRQIKLTSVIFVVFVTTIVFACRSFQSQPAKNVNKNTIVFLGNSITQVGKWQVLLPDKKVINKGISGDVTKGVLARIEDCLSAKPEKIFVMIGINDLKIGLAVDSITLGQTKIIKQIKKLSPQTKIYMQSTLPVNESMLANIYKRLNNEAINQMNAALKLVCKQQKVGYIDVHSTLTDQNGQLKQELSTDGLHLKPEAYVIWVNHLKTNKLL